MLASSVFLVIEADQYPLFPFAVLWWLVVFNGVLAVWLAAGGNASRPWQRLAVWWGIIELIGLVLPPFPLQATAITSSGTDVQLVARLTDGRTGAPVAGARVAMIPGYSRAVTDQAGVAIVRHAFPAHAFKTRFTRSGTIRLRGRLEVEAAGYERAEFDVAERFAATLEYWGERRIARTLTLRPAADGKATTQ